MAEWVQLTLGVLTIVGSVGASLAIVSFSFGSRLTRQQAGIEANATAIRNLADTMTKAVEGISKAVSERATIESVLTLTKRMDRDEIQANADAVDLGRRLDRKDTRLIAIETALPEIRASMAALAKAQEATQASINMLLERERRQPASTQPDLIAILSLATQALPLIQQLSGSQRAHA